MSVYTANRQAWSVTHQYSIQTSYQSFQCAQPCMMTEPQPFTATLLEHDHLDPNNYFCPIYSVAYHKLMFNWRGEFY